MILEIEDIEIEVLLHAIFLKYGYDFKNYSKSHIKRRIKRRMVLSHIEKISQLTEKVLYNKEFFGQILLDLSINTTEMFRFPQFYLALRKEVIPILRTYPSIKIWHAGCSTGEEIFSMAILLKEEGLLDKTRIFATDINTKVIDVAKEGIYSSKDVKKWTQNYQNTGGINSFANYYNAKFDSVIFDSELIKNVTFMEHNLVTDKSFIEANLIICRNVLIYFNKELQNNVLKLFLNSLLPGGILGLGSKEHLKFTEVSNEFEVVSLPCKLFKKKIF